MSDHSGVINALIELAHFERDMPRFTDAKARATALSARATISTLQTKVERAEASTKELEAALAQIRDQRGPYSNATVKRMAAIADAALRSREGEK